MKDPNTCIVIGGAGSYGKDIILENPVITFIKTSDLI
jgi:hypothetical protein